MHAPRIFSHLIDGYLPFWLFLDSFVRRNRGSIVVTSGTSNATLYDDRVRQ